MATTTTRNLKLKIDSNLTANAKYNLTRIDDLGAVYLVDSTETVNIRSKVDINLLPEDASTGGSGVGGVLNASTASQYLSSVNLYSNNTFLGKNLQIDDNASGGNKRLKVIYKSDINGITDTTADRQLAIDLDGANRSLVLAGDLSLLGGSLVANLTGPTSVTFPLTGTLATLANPETFSNKIIDAFANTILNITNSNINAAAAIAYSKLNLTGSIVNADVSPSAAIAYSKLSLSGSITNSDISNSASISYSKLNLLASIVNADIAPGAAIVYSKLALSNSIVNADITAGAAIDGTKISPDFGTQDITTSGKLQLKGPLYKSQLQAAQSGQASDLLFTLPSDDGTGGQVLSTDGTGVLSWITSSGSGTVSSVGLALPASVFNVSGSPVTASGTLTGSFANQNANMVFAGPASGGPGTPSFRALVVADVPGTLRQASTTWTPGDGATKVFNHALATLLLSVTVIDENGFIIHVDSIQLTDSNNITLISSETPAGNWSVIVQGA